MRGQRIENYSHSFSDWVLKQNKDRGLDPSCVSRMIYEESNMMNQTLSMGIVRAEFGGITHMIITRT